MFTAKGTPKKEEVEAAAEAGDVEAQEIMRAYDGEKNFEDFYEEEVKEWGI